MEEILPTCSYKQVLNKRYVSLRLSAYVQYILEQNKTLIVKSTPMALKNQIDQDIKSAMLAKDQVRLRSLRAIKSAILLAETEKNSGDFDEKAEIKVLQRLVKQRKESAEIYQQQNRPDLLAIEREEQEVIEQYLPKQMDRADIKKAIVEIVEKI